MRGEDGANAQACDYKCMCIGGQAGVGNSAARPVDKSEVAVLNGLLADRE